MAKQTINLGTGELTGDGESIRSAFDKINNNFDELYTKDASDVVLNAINGHIVPDTDVTYDLGSASNRFRDLYLSGSTIDLGGTTLSVVGGELQLGGVKVPTTADVAATIASAVSAPTGDLTGSVFADDSTLLVDGVNGSIPYSVISDVQVTEAQLNVDFAAIVGTQIQTNGLPVNTFTTGDLEVRGTLSREDGSDFELSSTDDVNINTSVGDENHTFEFMSDGTFYMSKNTSGNNSYISTPRNDNNAYLTLVSALDLIIETNEATGSVETWTFGADGTLTVPGNVYGGTGNRLWLGGEDSEGTPSVNIPNEAGGATLPIIVSNQAGGGVAISTEGGDWIYGADGSLEFPGSVTHSIDTTTGGTSTGSPTTLDVTKTILVLNSADTDDDSWLLPDGVEGQVIHLVPGTGAATNQHYVSIANWRKWDEGAGVAGEWRVRTGLDWTPFVFDPTGSSTVYRSLATAVFVNGAWQTDTPWID